MGKKIEQIYHIGVFLAVLVVLLLVSLPVYGGGTSASDAYAYPIKPGTDEWKAFTTHEEMLKACQIPEELLHRMSTTALVETVLNYPLATDWWAYDSTELGIKHVKKQFNGLSELLNRNDAGIALIASYQTIDPGSIDINSPIAEQAEYYFRILNIELLLSQDSVISSLSITDLQNLVSRARIVSESKLLRSDIFSSYSQEFTSSIVEKASKRQYSARDYYSYVYTPKGTAVEVIKGRTEYTPSEVQYWNNYWKSRYPYATLAGDSSRRYNCHAYAWNYPGPQDGWMNYNDRYGSANVPRYWNDGSYARWNGVPYNGLKVSYRSADHSAIIYNTSDHRYISKWGSGPVMIHSPSHCPYDATTVYYYRRAT